MFWKINFTTIFLLCCIDNQFIRNLWAEISWGVVEKTNYVMTVQFIKKWEFTLELHTNNIRLICTHIRLLKTESVLIFRFLKQHKCKLIF